MIFLSFIKLKADIMVRKQLLNIFLILFSPTNILTVALSKNLDKYIVLYQKQLFLIYRKKHNDSVEMHEFVA